MDVLRTPEDRFDDLPGPRHPHAYAEVADPSDRGGSLRMAYVDAGPADGPVALLLHGEPSWSFLYRDVVRVLAGAGIRCVVPDLVGFGRSDKPTRVEDHSYARHLEWVRALTLDPSTGSGRRGLDLREITLVAQDWGGLLGLRLVAEHPDRFARVVASNTGLPTGDHGMPEVWWRFRRAVETAEVLDVGRLVASGCARPLGEEVRAAYDAPYPDESFKAGPRAMPLLVPTAPDDPETPANRAAWATLTTLDLPFLVAFGDSDPITRDMGPILQRAMRGAQGLDHPVLARAGHFVQEDAGEQLGEVVAGFMGLAVV